METETRLTQATNEAEDTRERILVSSRKLFAEKGFDMTSVRDITSDAGCNVASVNYHFGGKENLYLETFRSMLTLLRDQRLAVLDELMERFPETHWAKEAAKQTGVRKGGKILSGDQI